MTARFRAEELVKRAMAVQAVDPRFAGEQREWLAHSGVDGIPMASASPATNGHPPTRLNRFASASDTEATVAADAALMVENEDGLIAICSAADDQQSWLKGGQALSALWLQATQGGLTVVPLSQVVEVEETRQALHRDVFDGLARPQILVRIGWSETTRTRLARTPRRRLDEVMGR